MLKKKITYTDFNGRERTEDFYFNLTQAELAQLESSVPGGISEYIQQIKDSENVPELVNLFKKIILMSYGEKSEDGKRFMKKKNGELLADVFESTEAFSVLFMELATNEDAATQFINGIVPKDAAPKQIPAAV
jgi:hypothetical protein